MYLYNYAQVQYSTSTSTAQTQCEQIPFTLADAYLQVTLSNLKDPPPFCNMCKAAGVQILSALF